MICRPWCAIIYGASPISEAVLFRAMAALPRARFRQAYGMTELSPVATVLHWEEHIGEGFAKGRHRSAGRATYDCEVRIVDPHRPARAGRRRRRDRGARRQCDDGLLGAPGGNRQSRHRRLDAHRRRRLYGRGRLRLHRRPHQGHDRHRRRERLFDRGRERVSPSIPRSRNAPSSAFPTRTGASRSTPSSCPAPARLPPTS